VPRCCSSGKVLFSWGGLALRSNLWLIADPLADPSPRLNPSNRFIALLSQRECLRGKTGRFLESGLGIGFGPLQTAEKSGHGWDPVESSHIHAMVNAIAHIDVEASRLTKQGFVAGSAASVAVAGRVVLGIRLRVHNHAPQQLATFLALHQQATDELGGDLLGGAGEDGWGKCWEGLGGYGSGLGRWVEVIERRLGYAGIVQKRYGDLL